MTDSKTPEEDPDIIEGVAVEKQAAARKRRSSAKKGGARTPGGVSEKGRSGTERSDKGPSGQDRQTNHEQARPARGGLSMAVLMSMVAILIAGAGLVVQEWRAMSRAAALQAEMAALATRLEVAERSARAAEGEAARLSGQMADRLAGLEAAIPDDPQTAISELATAQGELARRMEALESAPASATGVATGSEMVLAQTALTVAGAMLADSLSGGDAGRWLPVLEKLQTAGLDLDNLGSLRTALSPPPPSATQLLADAAAMMPVLREAGRDTAGGWWSSTADRLAGFVTLRRQDEPDDRMATDGASPIAGFESAVISGRLPAALEASEALGGALPEHAADINLWRISAERRLAADAALAGVISDMAARLARSGSGGKGE